MILCFGCGEAGHTTGSCPKVADLVSKKVIKRDPRGQLVMFNGEFIRRTYRDEPLISAAQKQAGNPQGLMITCPTGSKSENEGEDYELIQMINADESEEDYSEDTCEAYPVERTTTRGAKRRKEFEGVFVPERKVKSTA